MIKWKFESILNSQIILFITSFIINNIFLFSGTPAPDYRRPFIHPRIILISIYLEVKSTIFPHLENLDTINRDMVSIFVKLKLCIEIDRVENRFKV